MNIETKKTNNDVVTVVQSNDLIEASYSLSLDELRLISLALTKFNSKFGNVGEIKISVAEYTKAYDLKNTNLYTVLRESVKSLMRKPIKLYDEKTGKVRELAWLDMNEYNRSAEGAHVVISFSRQVEPYLFDLSESFTSIHFEFASRLNTPFSFRLYQWLIKAKKLDKHKVGDTIVVELEIEWMKSQAMISGSYDRFERFYSRVLRPALERINANTDISVSIERIMKGRKVNAIRFIYINEVATEAKPLRPRLPKRPQVIAGSDAEYQHIVKCFNLLKGYRDDLKSYDKAEKLTLADLRKLHSYAKYLKYADYVTMYEIEIENRTRK